MVDENLSRKGAEYADSTKEQQIEKVEPRHRAMMRLLISGYKVGDLVEPFGLSSVRISNIVNSPLFKEEMRRMEEQVNVKFAESEGSKTASDFVRIRLREEAQRSLDKLISLRDGAQSERVQQLSAIDILDRAGVKGAEKFEGELVLDASEGLVNALAEAVKIMRGKDELPK